ncbi:hypothetical protein DXV76_08475 [Rhodobacteraceae bacterium CCMM004]|nr:hypothetical protein DXV76_08475 [Rhodobacteraceae bacterium CCMM004]
MKRLFAAAAVLLATTVQPVLADHHLRFNRDVVVNRTVITVSCFRGPWREVIWDRPNPVFIDDLVGYGMDYPTAHAVAERVCRDKSMVGNLARMEAEIKRAIEAAPQYSRRSYIRGN